MSEKEDYFNYALNVLGVKSLYLDSVAAPQESIPLLVTVDSLSTYNLEEKELLEKMVAALKVDVNQIRIVDAEAPIAITYNFLLNFSDSPNQNLQNTNQLSTYSSRALLKDSSLKKKAWNDLQKVIQFFSV